MQWKSALNRHKVSQKIVKTRADVDVLSVLYPSRNESYMFDIFQWFVEVDMRINVVRFREQFY